MASSPGSSVPHHRRKPHLRLDHTVPLHPATAAINTINNFHHRPSIASIIREKRLQHAVSLSTTQTQSLPSSASSPNSPSCSAFDSIGSADYRNPRRARSRGCTRMGGLSDLSSTANFDSYRRPALDRTVTDPRLHFHPSSDSNRAPLKPCLTLSTLADPSEQAKSSTLNHPPVQPLRDPFIDSPNPPPPSSALLGFTAGLAEVVMTPTTEEWWSLGGKVSREICKFPDHRVSPIISDKGIAGEQDDNDNEDDDDDDESDESAAGISFSPTSLNRPHQTHNTALNSSHSRPASSSSSPRQFLAHNRSPSSQSKPTHLDLDSTLLNGLSNSNNNISPTIELSPGLFPTEPEPTLAMPTLTSVNGIIHMPPTSSVAAPVKLSLEPRDSVLPTLSAMSSQSIGLPTDSSATRGVPLSPTALLSSLLDIDQRSPHSPTSTNIRPCSLQHDGTVRKSVDPRSYSAFTGYRNIDSFVINTEAGKGAYGVVKNAREKGSDGQPVGPPLMIKCIIKQRILADCWKRHKVLGPIPIEIHVLDHLRRVNYRSSLITYAQKYIADRRDQGMTTPLETIPSRSDIPLPSRDSTHSSHGLQRTGHPNICGILDYFEDPDFYYLIMPRYGEGKDLFDYIELFPDGLLMVDARKIAEQIVDAVAFLHERNIVHRDLKDENVILDEQGNAQLIDFGSAAYIREGKKFDTFSGTLDFAAPEVLRGERHGGKEIDVWALGVLLYVLICGECPFWNPEEALQGLEPGTRAERTLKQKAGLSESTIDLLKNCLRLQPADRPMVETLCWHEFFVGRGGWRGLPPSAAQVDNVI